MLKHVQYIVSITYLVIISVAPADGMELIGLENEYEVGKKVEAECRVPQALPPPNITWTLNGLQVSTFTR